MKTCTRCGNEQPPSEFYRQAASADGLQAWCKSCYRQRDREKYTADPEAAKQKIYGWRERRKAADPEEWTRYKRNATLKSTYGITLDEWETLYDSQLGRCAICHVTFGEAQPCVDHDHETGAVRGLLCPTCNLGLGYFRDDPTLLQRAIDYVHSANSEGDATPASHVPSVREEVSE